MRLGVELAKELDIAPKKFFSLSLPNIADTARWSAGRARCCERRWVRAAVAMLHALLTVAYTPHTASGAPPRRPVRAWAACTAAGSELTDQQDAPADECVSSHLPPLPILLRTDDYIVVAKPANTVVHRNRFIKKGDVPLMQRLRDQLGVRVNPVRAASGPRPRPRPRPHPK